MLFVLFLSTSSTFISLFVITSDVNAASIQLFIVDGSNNDIIGLKTEFERISFISDTINAFDECSGGRTRVVR